MDAQARFAKQMTLLDQIATTVGERAALAELSGGAAAAATLSGLPKADIEAAARSVEPAEVAAVVQAATPAGRRRRKSAAELATGVGAIERAGMPPRRG
jgi:predicted nuclease with TOPRIM domain